MKVLRTLLTVAILSSSAFASTTTCPSGDITLYLVPNFSCTSGNLIFSGFSYIGTGNPAGGAIPASGVNVSPITVTGAEGFQFVSGWSIGTQSGGEASFQESLIQYVVTDALGIVGAIVSFNGGATGTGGATATETFCLNQNTLLGCPAAQIGQVKATNPPMNLSGSASFPPATEIAVSKDIIVTSGVDGTASISQVFDQYPQLIPEPLPFALLGTGLIVMGLIRRRGAQRR